MANPRSAVAAIAAALAGAFFFAAVQLLPTWELKQQSQRQAVSAEHDPGYGYIPPRYLLQMVAPWHWYTDDRAFNGTMEAGGARTNRVEAHLYFGIIPLGLIVVAIVKFRRNVDRRYWVWLGLGGLSVVYATGILIPVTRHLPGFSFFEGAGRFGIVATLVAGLWAGRGLDLWVERCRRPGRKALVAIVLLLTAGDLWLVSRQFVADPWLMQEHSWLVGPQSKFVYLVGRPPIARLKESPLRQLFAEQPQPVRLFSEGKNLPSLLGVSTLPVYLGLGPAAYFEAEHQIPGEFSFRGAPTSAQVEWLRQSGVTHLLSFVPLDPRAWPVEPVWAGVDQFLNQALARGGDEPSFVYRIKGGRGRIAWRNRQFEGEIRLVEYSPQRVSIETEAKQDGCLILTDLAYPGWQVSIDGKMANAEIGGGVFREVDVFAGKHTVIWNYRPASLYWGAGTSVATVVLLLIMGHIRYWHPQWFGAAAISLVGSRSTTT